MEHTLDMVLIWLVVLAETLVALVALSYLMFGGKIHFSIELNDPWRLFHKRNNDHDPPRTSKAINPGTWTFNPDETIATLTKDVPPPPPNTSTRTRP